MEQCSQPTQGAGYNLLQDLEHVVVNGHSRIRVRELFDKVPMTGGKEKEKQERPGNICKADELMLGIHFIRKVEGLAERSSKVGMSPTPTNSDMGLQKQTPDSGS